MLHSVTALNPHRRFRTTVLSVKNLFLKNGVRNVGQAQFHTVTGPKRLPSSFSTQSNQLEYDSRPRSAAPKSIRIDYKSSETTPIRPVEKLPDVDDSPIPKPFTITIVDTVARAREVLEIMYRQQISNPRTIWACDTESADIDLSVQGTFHTIV